MADLNVPNDWSSSIYQIEQDDPVLGGTPNLSQKAGVVNIPHLQLAQRTQWLKARVAELEALIQDVDVSSQIQEELANWVNGSPAALDTFQELAAAVADNDTELGSIIDLISSKLSAANNLSDIADPDAARANIGAGVGTPIGAILPFHQEVAPVGWIVCDGSSVTGLYPDLRAHLLAQPNAPVDGAGNPLLPDLRGEFLRGLDGGRGVDTGRGLGTAQGDAIRNITGQIGTIGVNGTIDGAFEVTGNAGKIDNSGHPDRQVNFDASRVVPTAEENRPRNVAFLYCIKAYDEVLPSGSAVLSELLDGIATITQARLGEDNTKLMTPARTAEAIRVRTPFELIPMGDYLHSPNLGNKRFNVKLLGIDADANGSFLVELKGYCYGAAKVLNMSFGGYNYSPTQRLVNSHVADMSATGFSTGMTRKSDGIYLWFECDTRYVNFTAAGKKVSPVRTFDPSAGFEVTLTDVGVSV